MGLIESATKRLDTLARAGIVVARTGRHSLPHEGPSPAVEGEPTACPPLAWAPERFIDLDVKALSQKGYITPSLGRSQLADEFRRPKRVLLHNAHHPPKAMGARAAMVMVTSALPGEGKTFCALNLALSMAMELHSEILLVDADTVRPSMLNRLGLMELASQGGLTDLLSHSDLDLKSLAFGTNIPRLSILPPGQSNDRAHELFASERMKTVFLDWIRQGAHRVVVMDAPACLVTSEAQALAALAGQIVVVVKAQDTPSSLVKQTFDSLKEAPWVYSILNQCTEQPTAQRYGDAYAPPVSALQQKADAVDV